MRRSVALLVASVVVASCGSSAGSVPSGPKGEVSVEGAAIGTVVPAGAVRGSSSVLVTAEGGGTVSLQLADGATATLEVPPGAVMEPLIVTLVEASTGPRGGIELEPSGTWFARPARLSFDDGRIALSRLGALPDGDLYGDAAILPDGALPVYRLRPFIFADPNIVPTFVTPDSRGGYPLPESGRAAPAVDALDAASRDAELALTSRGGSSVSGGDDGAPTEGQDSEGDAGDAVSDEPGSGEGAPPRGAAAAASRAYEARCAEPGTVARTRIVEARRTAGPEAPPKPECIGRAIRVMGSLDQQYTEAGQTWTFRELLSASGPISNAVESTSLPLSYDTNIQEFYSLAVSGGIRGFGYLAYVVASSVNVPGSADAAQKSKKIADDEESRVRARDRCSLKGLLGGAMSVSLVELPDGRLRVSMSPAGKWDLNCGEFPVEPADPLVWPMIRAVRAMADGAPFIAEFPKGAFFSNVLAEGTVADQAVAKNGNGSVTITEGSTVMVVSMVVNLAESMEEMRRRDGEPVPTTTGK